MKRLTQNEQASLILIFAFIFGAWFRIMPAWMAGFSINDGGMFYRMILDLQYNGYAQIAFTSYNHLNIPYAYPPLGFYLAAFLSDLLRAPVLEVVRWLPGILNALTVPAFYFFAKEVFKDKFQAALAALVFALIPHLTSWNGMGGGLTRSPGMVFMLLTLGFALRVFEGGGARSILWAALFGGLTVLSHAEAPIYTIALAALFWLVKSRSWKSLLRGALVALGVLLLGGWWYALVIARHGFAPFQSIAQTGAHSAASIFKALNVHALTEEPYLGLLAALGILGMAWLLLKKEGFIPLMALVVFIVQPRSAHMIANIPLALAAGVFIAEVLLPALKQAKGGQAAFWALLAVYLLSNSLLYSFNLSRKVLGEGEREAMQWARQNTPADSRFLVLSGDPNPFCDPVTEWFPALSERQSQTTIQGAEWILASEFGARMLQSVRLQACADEGLACFARESAALGLPYDYVYVSISPATENCGLADSPNRTARALELEMRAAPDYVEVYRSADAVIFSRRR